MNIWRPAIRTIFVVVCCLTPWLLVVPPCYAHVTVAPIFSDNMILQANSNTRVYGTADPDENISVSFAGHEAKTTANKAGGWEASLGKLKSGARGELVIKGSDRSSTLIIRNVLAGEVWLCAGQSNMAFPVRECSKAQSLLTQKENPEIRFFIIAPDMANIPQQSVSGKWQVCNSKNLPKASAIGILFAQELQRTLHRPVGIIQAAYGGSSIKTWISKDVLVNDPVLAKQVTVEPNSPAFFMRFEIDKDEKERKLSPHKPHTLASKFSQPLVPCTLYNAMVAPLTCFSIRGIAWYQGEADAEESKLYERLFPALIADWRQKWDQGNIPFLFVQLPSFKDSSNCIPTENSWARLRAAQSQALKLTNTAMVVAIDQGEPHNLHPKRKEVVAHRMALSAIDKAYGGPKSSGPVFANSKTDKDKLICSFSQAIGLHAKDGHPSGFEVCGADKVFFPAVGEIIGATIALQSSKVASPVGARYGWANNPPCNVYNAQDLPLSPFSFDSANK